MHVRAIATGLGTLALAGISLTACSATASHPASAPVVTATHPAATTPATAPAASVPDSAPGAYQSYDSSAPGGYDGSNPGGYTDAQDCTTLGNDYTTFAASKSSQDLFAFQTDLTADGSGLTDSPTLASAATALSHDVNVVAQGGQAPASSTSDEQAVANACSAVGVQLPAGFTG